MMKILIKSIVLVILFTLPASEIYAESIFMKDGTIIDGIVVKDSEMSSTVRTQNGKVIEISKKDILRVIFDAGYKNKIYIYKLNGDVIEAYIVNEDRESYTYRTDLASSRETVLKKSQINLISRQKLPGIKEKAPLVKPVLFDRFMNFKLGYSANASNSTTVPGVYVPGFEFGYGFYDKVIEFEMTMSVCFGKADADIFSRLNFNFVFGNIFGFGIGFYTAGSKHEINSFQPFIQFDSKGIVFGPVLRIPNVLHVSLFMLLPTGTDVYYKQAQNGNSFYYEPLFNFNFLLAVDIFVWKSLSVGISYVLTGGEYTVKEGSSQIPQYYSILFYNHQIVLSVGLGFNL